MGVTIIGGNSPSLHVVRWTPATFIILSILKAGKGYLNISLSLLAIYKRFHILIKDHVHITDIEYKPFYNEAYLFRPLKNFAWEDQSNQQCYVHCKEWLMRPQFYIG